MPVNAGAAAATVVYRRSLGLQRDGAATAITSALAQVDLDLPRPRLRKAFGEFNAYTAELISSGVSRAADLSDLYVDTYLVAASVAPDGAEYSATELQHRSLASELVTDHVVPALLWRLASGAGRLAAQNYARAVAERQTRVAIGDAARYRVSERLRAERSVSGWRRVTGPTTCNLCAAEAGQLFGDGTELASRCHPSCRCSAEPVLRDVPELVTRAAPAVITPGALGFDRATQLAV